MRLFEFEAKQLLRERGIRTPGGALVTSIRQKAPMGFPFVLKAQVMAGGRGKAGGVKICHTQEAYAREAERIMQMEIRNEPVHGLLAEELESADRELYISITAQGVDEPTLIFSRLGGMDIERVADETPDEIWRFAINPFTRLKEYQKRKIADLMQIDRKTAFAFLEKLESAFFENGALLTEINPLGVLDGDLIALDAKMILDDHRRDIKALRDEIEGVRSGLYRYHAAAPEKTTVTYVPLKGDVALISDGAGTGMMTLDLLADMGIQLSCFAELGGMTTEEVMHRALELALSGNPGIKAVFIVLIGGFNRMDNMARGITGYVSEHAVKIPIFTRMCGTAEEEGIRIMREAGLDIDYDLTEMAEKLRSYLQEKEA